MGRLRKYSDLDVVRVANLRASGLCYRSIAKELKLPLSVVWRMGEGQYYKKKAKGAKGQKAENTKPDNRTRDPEPNTDMVKP